MDQCLPTGWVCSVPTARASHLFFLTMAIIMASSLSATTMAANMESSAGLGDTSHEALIRLARFQPDPTGIRDFVVSPAVFRRGAFPAESSGGSTLMLVRRDGMVIRRHRRAVTSSANGVARRNNNNKRNPIIIGGGRIPHALQQKFAALAAKKGKHQQQEEIKVVAAGDPGVPQQLTDEPSSVGQGHQEEIAARKQEPEKVINGKNGPVKLKVPNSAGRPYLALDEDHIGLKNTAFSPVQKNPAMSNKADSGSSINDLDDFMSAMKAGQKMWKEKVMKSGSAVKTGGSVGHAIASKFSSSRGSSISANNNRVIPSKVVFGRNNGLRGVNTGGNGRIKREAGSLKRRRCSPHRIPLNPVVRKVRQGVYGLNRMRPLQGNVGTPNMRGPIDFPGAPNYVPSLPNRRVGAPRGPYTTPAYGPKAPPPVASRMNQQQHTMNNDEHPMVDDYAEEDFDAGAVYRAPGRVSAPPQQQQEEAAFDQHQQQQPSSLKRPEGGRLFQQQQPQRQMMVDQGMAPAEAGYQAAGPPSAPLGNIGRLNKFRPMKQIPEENQQRLAGGGMMQSQQQHGHPGTGDVTDILTDGGMSPSVAGDVQQRHMAPGLDRKPAEYPGLVARQTAGAAGQRSRSEGNPNSRHGNNDDFAADDEGEPAGVDDYIPARTRISSLRKAPLGTAYVSLRDREAAAEQDQLDNHRHVQQQMDRVADDVAADYHHQEDVNDPVVVAAAEEEDQQQVRQQKERLGAGMPTGMWRKPMDNPASMSMARRFGLEWGRRSTLLNMPMQVHQGMMPLAKLNG